MVVTTTRGTRTPRAAGGRTIGGGHRPVAFSLARMREALAREGVRLGHDRLLAVLSHAAGHWNAHETQALLAEGALAPAVAEPLGVVTASDGTRLLVGHDLSEGGGTFAIAVRAAREGRHRPSPYGTGLVDLGPMLEAAEEAARAGAAGLVRQEAGRAHRPGPSGGGDVVALSMEVGTGPHAPDHGPWTVELHTPGARLPMAPRSAAATGLLEALEPFAHYARVADPSDMDPLRAVPVGLWLGLAEAYRATSGGVDDEVRRVARPFADAVSSTGGAINVRTGKIEAGDWEAARRASDAARGRVRPEGEAVASERGASRGGKGFVVRLAEAPSTGDSEVVALRFAVSAAEGVEDDYGTVAYETLVPATAGADARELVLDVVAAATAEALRVDPRGRTMRSRLGVLSWLAPRHLDYDLPGAYRNGWDVVGLMLGTDGGARVATRASLPLSLKAATSNTWVALFGPVLDGEVGPPRWEQFDGKRAANALAAAWKRTPPARQGSMVG